MLVLTCEGVIKSGMFRFSEQPLSECQMAVAPQPQWIHGHEHFNHSNFTGATLMIPRSCTRGPSSTKGS